MADDLLSIVLRDAYQVAVFQTHQERLRVAQTTLTKAVVEDGLDVLDEVLPPVLEALDRTLLDDLREVRADRAYVIFDPEGHAYRLDPITLNQTPINYYLQVGGPTGLLTPERHPLHYLRGDLHVPLHDGNRLVYRLANYRGLHIWHLIRVETPAYAVGDDGIRPWTP